MKERGVQNIMLCELLRVYTSTQEAQGYSHSFQGDKNHPVYRLPERHSLCKVATVFLQLDAASAVFFVCVCVFFLFCFFLLF